MLISYVCCDHTCPLSPDTSAQGPRTQSPSCGPTLAPVVPQGLESPPLSYKHRQS